MKWKMEDDEILRLFWFSKTHAEIAAMLPGRSEQSVRNRCWRLKLIHKKEWSEIEVNVLRKWYEVHDGQLLKLAHLAALLGRSEYSLAMKAGELGITNKARKKGGTKDRRMFKGDTAALREHQRFITRERIANRGHPRGMLGKKQSKEAAAKSAAGRAEWRVTQTKKQLSEIAIRSVNTKIAKYGTAAPPGFMDGSSNPYSRTKRGRREDLGNIFFRSRWEANYARFLNLLKSQNQIIDWQYEPDTFWFEAIRRGVRSYTPDFKIWDRDGSIYYTEVKGWMDAKSKTKLKRMKKYHPTVDVRLFGEKAYRELARKLGGAIPGWESA